jgi:hypothetical protein
MPSWGSDLVNKLISISISKIEYELWFLKIRQHKSGNVIQMVYEKACVVFYATELQNFNGKLVSMKSPVA